MELQTPGRNSLKTTRKLKLLLSACIVFGFSGTATALPPVTNGLRVAFDASAIAGATNGQVLNTWPDVSGNGNNGTKGGYGAYTGPHFYTNRQNGLSAVNCSNYVGDVGEWFRFSSVTPRQVFFVARDMRGGGQSQVMGQGGTYDWHNAGPSAVFANLTGYAGHWIGKLNGTNISLVAQRWVQYQPFILSINLPETWARYTDRMCSDRDGYGYRAWGGDLFEVLLYNQPLSAYDENAVGYYLQCKWTTNGAYVPPPPEVDNSGGATGVTASAAWLSGNLIHSGLTNCDVWVYYDTDGGSTNFGDWATNALAGTNLTPQTFATNVSGLLPDTLYYYRCFATNSMTQSTWSVSSGTFLTGHGTGTGNVWVVSTDPYASELGPDPGVFTIHRPTSATNGPLTVYYTVSGTASNGVDYSWLNGTVTVPAGSDTADVTVAPMEDALIEGEETVILTIAAGSYVIGVLNSAAVTIDRNGTVLLFR